MLIHHWSHPTTPAGVGWDIVQSGVVRLTTEKGFIQRAVLGEADIIRVVVDDPTGVANYKRLHRWYMVEDETPGDLLVWNGYITDQFIDHGASDMLYPNGVGRVWELEISQENTLLGFRVVTDTDGDRPAENPDERLTWLLGSDYLSTVIDHGLIDHAGLAAFPDMDAVDYRDQTAGDVLRSISLVTNYNHYARYRDASSDIELAFYEPNLSELDESALMISNDPADLDPEGDFASNGIYAPFMTTRHHRKGDRVSAGIVVVGDFPAGRLYDYSLPTSYEFGFTDMVVPANNIKTDAAAQRLLDRLLIQHSTQDERIEQCGIRVNDSELNEVKHGQRIQAKFTHFPGWEDFRWARVISKTFSRPEGEPQTVYDIELELSPQFTGCQAQASLIDLFNSGESGVDFVPISATPNTPSVYPSVVMTFFIGCLDGTDIGYPLTVGSPWDLTDSWAPSSGGRHMNIAICALPLASGAPDPCVIDWDGHFSLEARWRMLGFSLATAATAPVQIASQIVTGGTTTLPSPPTPGNILVVACYAEDAGDADAVLPIGWAQKGFVNMADDEGAQHGSMVIGTWCVQEGDFPDGEIATGEGSFAHWAFVQEWAFV